IPIAANPLEVEFPYINENLEDLTDVETKEEARERESRVEVEIRAQIEEIERLQAEVEVRAAAKFVAIEWLEAKGMNGTG
ncbi:hypothetical protein KI387_032066, partial [Taxus chinensis]